MGDFDRVQQPGAKTNETKKVAMVVVLGAVLLGMLGFQMLKKGPGQAAAANTSSGSEPAAAAPGIDQPTEVLRAALAQDPSASYDLTGQGAVFPTSTLRNPFRMSQEFHTHLKPEKPPEIKPVVPVNPVEPVRPPVHITPAAIKSLPPAAYKLSMITVIGGNLSAMINARLVSAGAIIGDALVVEVRDDGVTLRHKDEPSGPTLELTLRREL
jgi:hypothetical protein